ncbi:MAG: DUF697 domain-containing protein [Methylococcales bacterium]|nr:DUF697 domain-containing protein [Methylococcales bacterium]
MTNEVKSTQDRTRDAEGVVQTSMYCAAGLGIIPIPVFDLIGITGIQIDMLRRLSNLYDVPFMESKGKNILGSLIGGGFSYSLAPVLASLTKFIPVVGSTLGAVSMPITAGATTYAVGKVFIQHFESGGTFLTFDPEAVREFYSSTLKEGNAIMTKEKAAAAPVATATVAKA